MGGLRNTVRVTLGVAKGPERSNGEIPRFAQNDKEYVTEFTNQSTSLSQFDLVPAENNGRRGPIPAILCIL